MKEVSEYLGNTPAVAKASYVDPRVVDLYNSGVTIAESLARVPAEAGGFTARDDAERAVRALLRDESG